METAEQWADRAPVPDAVLDGGEEEWNVLLQAIERSLARMTSGDALEIVSQDPRTRATVPAWCLLHGHDLLRTVAEGSCTCFLVRKGAT
jgi:TusA-related sulfurtransferase